MSRDTLRGLVEIVDEKKIFYKDAVADEEIVKEVCREIALAHGWKLRYLSAKEEGTKAVCRFR